jgi:hypothetical protein
MEILWSARIPRNGGVILVVAKETCQTLIAFMTMNIPVREVTTKDSPSFGEQDSYGNSLASLRINLQLTPIERLRKAERAARFVAKYRGVVHRKH